jgi:hypothetical protein
MALLFGGCVALPAQLVSDYGEDRHQQFTVPLGDVNSVPQGLTVRVTVHHCVPSLADDVKVIVGLWCIDYGLQRYGTLDLFDMPQEVKLRFDIGGLCLKKPTQWSETTRDEFGFSTSSGFHLEDAQGCTVELVKVSPVSNDLPEIDFTDQLKSIQAQRDADAARARRLAAEAKKARSEQTAKEVAERQKVRLSCAAIYQSTIDKKVRDLTVREEEQVRTCQALDLYPPR